MVAIFAPFATEYGGLRSGSFGEAVVNRAETA
jgi:hypothetical protein